MIAAHIANWSLTRHLSDEEEGRRVAAYVAIPKKQKRRKKPTKAKKRKPKAPKQEQEPAVLETKGGGTPAPAPPDPMADARARDWEAQQEFDRQQRQAASDKQAADEAKAASDAAWTSSKGSAYNAALNAGLGRLNSLGIQSGDPYGVTGQWEDQLNAANAGLTTGADYSSAFSPTILDTVLGNARTSQRNKYSTQFNTDYSPYAAEDQFNSGSDDAILNSILGKQFTQAQADLQAAQGRGQVNSAVYNRALSDLDTTKGTALSDLQNIGRGVRETDIANINKRRQGSLDTAAGWDFGSTYDPQAEANRVSGYAGDLYSGLEGDITGAVGGKQYFDVNSLLGNAAARVGNATTPVTGGGSGSGLFDTFQNQAAKDAAGSKSNEGIF